MKKRLAVTIGVVFLASSGLCAGSLQPEQVSAKAKWVVHLDVEALVGSGLGQYLVARGKQKHKDAEAKLKEFTASFGFDPLKDLQSVTLYGETFGPAAGVAIIRGRYDKDKLLKLLADNQDHKELKYGERVLHRWSQSPEGKDDDGMRIGAFYSDEVVVIARTEAVLKKAIDVLAGEQASLAKQESSLLPEAPEGTFLIAAADGFTAPEGVAPTAAVLKKLTGGTAVVGQNGDTVFPKVSRKCKNEEDATRIRKMVEGLLAFVQMSQEPAGAPVGNVPAEVAAILADAKASATGNTVLLEVSTALADLKAAIEETEKLRQAKAPAKPEHDGE